MRLYRLVLISLLLLVFCFCTGSSTLQSLKNIEGYIQSDPQKAYLELSKVDRESLSRAEEQALYYLLYSMALDKNYVDLKSDSLINRAVHYYSKRRDRLHCFYSYYYLGRVYSNAGSYDKALSAFLSAERYAGRAIPVDYIARLHFNKSKVYRHHFANDKAMAEATKAKEIAKQLDNPDFYIAYALNESNLYYITDNHIGANNTLKEISKWMKRNNLKPTHDYYRVCLQQALVSNITQDSLNHVYSQYISSCKTNGITPNPLQVTNYLIKINNYDAAKEAFKIIPVPEQDNYFDIIKYYSTLSALCKAAGRWKEYTEAQQEYQRAVELINLSVFNNDIRFLEERNKNSEERKHSITDIILLLVALIVVLTVGGCTAWVQRRKLKENKRLLDEAREEYSFITNLFSKSEGNTPEAIKQVLDTRIKALRPYIITSKAPTQKGRKALETIDKDRREMLSSIGMLYALTYPKYTSSLADKGLSAEEIGLCSLYVCGYSSKEMLDLLNKGDIYHLNSGIRSKIGDEIGSRTLHSWLKDLFNQSQ